MQHLFEEKHRVSCKTKNEIKKQTKQSCFRLLSAAVRQDVFVFYFFVFCFFLLWKSGFIGG